MYIFVWWGRGTRGEEAFVCLSQIFSVDINFHIYKMETLAVFLTGLLR